MFEIDGNYYHFQHGGKLLVTSVTPPVEGFYSVFQRENRCYLQTDPEIIEGKKELPLDLVLGERFVLLD